MKRLPALIALVAGAALGQPAPKLTVPIGSIGVAYSVGVDKTGQLLRVVFTQDVAPQLQGWSKGGRDLQSTAPVSIGGDLVLFDDKGVLGRLTPGPAAVRFWCENDGGRQFRPELQATFRPDATKRKLTVQPRLQMMAGFVAVVPKDPKVKLELPEVAWPATSDERAMDGDFDGDKKPEAVIYVAPDEAGNCDNKPPNNLTMTLVTGSHGGPLRCCGP